MCAINLLYLFFFKKKGKIKIHLLFLTCISAPCQVKIAILHDFKVKFVFCGISFPKISALPFKSFYYFKKKIKKSITERSIIVFVG